MLVSEVVVTYLEIAANHLGGLAVLYRHGEAMFPPLPIARSILELAAHVRWVLGDPSGIADDILARAYLEELNSRETAKQAAGRMHSKDSAAHRRARQEWAEFRDRVIAVFPDTSKADLGGSPMGRTIAGQMFPGPEAPVADLFELLHRRAGGQLDRAPGLRDIWVSVRRDTSLAVSSPTVTCARRSRWPRRYGSHSAPSRTRTDTVQILSRYGPAPSAAQRRGPVLVPYTQPNRRRTHRVPAPHRMRS
jgi:hypothetical protein